MAFEYDPEQWQDRQDASFRNVPFYLVSLKGKTGRRSVTQEYPKKNSGNAQDNGSILRHETIQAELIGPDAEAEFARLLDALNTAGPGELVHPYWGIQQVQIGDVDYDLNNQERYVARLSFTVHTVDDNLFTHAQADTSATTKSQANNADSAGIAQYRHKLSDLETQSQQVLLETVDAVLDDLDSAINNLPGLPDEIGDWMDRLEHTQWSVGRLLSTPGELAEAVLDLITDINDLVTELPQSLNVYDQLANRWRGLKAELESEPTPQTEAETKAQQQANVRYQTYALSHASAVVAKTKAIAAAPKAGVTGGFSDSEQASDAAETLGSELRSLAETAINDGDRECWRAYRALRTAVSNDLSERIRQLPDIKHITPNRALPVALLAYRQTGDTDNREIIVNRNRLSRPSFITPHQTIEIVMTEEGNDG
jgi:prophage DNA circulation protein